MLDDHLKCLWLGEIGVITQRTKEDAHIKIKTVFVVAYYIYFLCVWIDRLTLLILLW